MQNTAIPSLDELVLTRFPYPIALRYRQLLDAPDWRSKVDHAISTFELSLRFMTLCLISNYLIRDADRISDPRLNELLLKRFPSPTLGYWKELFFGCLQAYGERRELVFLKDLYDLYWDTSHEPNRMRSGVQAPYERLIALRNQLVHRASPTTDAEWQAIGEASLSDLRQVLGQFAFIEGYDLIRITQRRGDQYDYQIFTGLEVRASFQPLVSKQVLNTDWFYLLDENINVLTLDPMVIYWIDPSLSQSSMEQGELALYDSLTKSAVRYLGFEKEIIDSSRVENFIHVLYETIEQLKRYRMSARDLTWTLAQEIASSIASQRFGDIFSKYDRGLYLQRAEVRNAFDQFLESNKTALLLLGKAGAGKTSFLASLADEFKESDAVCLLLYNGATLETDSPLVETIRRDWSERLRLKDGYGERALTDVLAEIGQMRDIEQRKVILVVDAVNENANARELVRRIDALVGANPYPWFKVVFAARPEAWKVLRRGVRLSEGAYFRLPGREQAGIELQPFGVDIVGFSRAELPSVYEKYRVVYHLQTPFDQLSAELRRVMNDPLTLKLVAETYHSTSIPATLRPSDIYATYIDQLVRQERLSVKDVAFLERDLMPLMISQGHYENRITPDQLVGRTVSGKPLFELIHDDGLLASGERVNQSFLNLCDTEILTMLGSPTDYAIGFKYQRIYDYYAGNQLHQLFQSWVSAENRVSHLLEIMATRPFVQEAVQRAFFLFARESNPTELVLEIAKSERGEAANIALGLITDIAAEEPAKARQITGALLDDRTSLLAPKRVALEAAVHQRLEDVLEQAALARSTAVVNLSAQYISRYWFYDSHATISLLDRISKRMFGIFDLPKSATLSLVFGVSLTIALGGYADAVELNRLRDIWRSVLDRVLGFSAKRTANPLARLNAFLRRWIMQFILVNLTNYARSVAFRGLLELEQFFRLEGEARTISKGLVPFLDIQNNSIKDARDLLVNLARKNNRDLVLTILSIVVLYSQSLAQPEAVLEILQELFDVAVHLRPVGPFAAVVPIYTLLLMTTPPSRCSDRQCELLLKMVTLLWNTSEGKWSTDLMTRRATYLCELSEREARDPFQSLSPTADALIERLANDKNIPWIVDIIRQDLAAIGTSGNGGLALSAAARLIRIPDPLVTEALVDLMRTLRARFPDEVDDFVDESASILPAQAVRAEIVNSGSNLAGLGTLAGNLRLIEWSRSGPNLPALVWLGLDLSEERNLGSWLANALKVVINAIYGEPVFPETLAPTVPSLDWKKWERQITNALRESGQVSARDLRGVDRLEQNEVLERYLIANSRYDLTLAGNRLAFGPAAAAGRLIFAAWQAVARAMDSDVEAFAASALDLIQRLAGWLETEYELMETDPNWIAATLDLSDVFTDVELLRHIPLVIPKRAKTRSGDLRLLYSYLSDSKKAKTLAQVAILCLVAPPDPSSQGKAILNVPREHAYGWDIIGLGPDDLFELIVTRDRDGFFRQFLLSQIELTTISPYQDSGATPDKMFFGREDQIQEITTHAKDKSFLILGGRRIGKTSLLKRLFTSRLPAVGFHTIYHDCGHTTTLESFLSSPAGSWGTDSDFDSIMTFRDLLGARRVPQPLVLLLDEVDALVVADRAAGWPLWKQLRALSNSQAAQVVACGSHGLREALHDSDGPLYNFGKSILLGPLDRRAVKNLITQPMKQLAIRLEEEEQIVDRIFTFTSGHPHLTQRMCNRLLEQIGSKEARVIRLNDVDRVIKQSDFINSDFLGTYFSTATVLEHVCAIVMARDLNLRETTQIRQALETAGVTATLNQVRGALERLEELRNILRRTDAGWEFAVTAFPQIMAMAKSGRVSELIALRREIFDRSGDIPPESAPPELRGGLW